LAQGAVKESLDRIRAALAASGYTFPRGAVTVNLAPADTRKDGSAFDLPIALGILAADGQINASHFMTEQWLVMGELMLDARVRAVQGVMPAIMNARNRGINHALIPRGNLPETAKRKHPSSFRLREGTASLVLVGLILPPSSGRRNVHAHLP